MMPPVCEVCGYEDDGQGSGAEVVYFKCTTSDEDWYRRQKEEGFTGHPPNAIWFCHKHIALARQYEHITAEEALPKIKTKGSFLGMLKGWFLPE